MKKTISLLVPIKGFQLHSNSHNYSVGSYQIKTVLIGANYMASNYLIPKRVFKITDGVNKENLEPCDSKMSKTYQVPIRTKQEDNKWYLRFSLSISLIKFSEIKHIL